MNLQRICWRQSLWQLSPSCRRSMSQAAAAAGRQDTGRRGFTMPALWSGEHFTYARENGVHDRDDPSNNMRRLYSATGFNTAYTMYQQRMIDGVNQRIAERGYEGDMKDIAIQTARDPAQAALFNHASMAWNNHFFFEGISPSPTASPSTSESQIPLILQDALKADFGSIESFRAEMLAMADAMFGPGFVWLVRVSVTPGIFNKRKFMLLPTYLAGSPLPGAHNRRQPVDMNTQNVANAQAHGSVEGLSRAQYRAQHMEPQNTVGYMGQHAKRDDLAYGGVNLTPCLCVNTWEHAYMYDWKYNKKMFLERWWNFVNWERVNTLADVARDKEADGRRQFQGVSSAFGRRY